jgi:4-amino-4-deoxy-L-arabinose transferase-like glycosyltransferase
MHSTEAPIAATSPSLDRRALLIVAALYAVAHVLFWIAGIRFDATTLTGYMQFIDVQLLQTRLLESLWYYHANPPLLNLLAGVGLKAFGSDAPLFFSIVFHLLGLLLALCVHVLTWRLSASRIAAHVATAVLVFSPSFVLYENWLMYSFPAAALLTLAAALLHRYVRTGSTRWCAAFFWALALLLLTRSLFHLGWMILVTVLLTGALWERRKQVLVCAALPLLIIVLWYGKNYYLFGTFSSSTWFGLGLSNISTLAVTREELAPLVQRGQLSPFALVSRYTEMNQLFTSQQLEPTGVPVLDQVRKSTGQYNWNSQQLLAINHYYAHDGIEVIRTFPASYVLSWIIANRLFFSPSSMNLYFSPGNRAAAQPIEAVFNRLFYGVSSRPGLIQQPRFGFNRTAFLEVNTSAMLFVAWWLCLLYGYVQARQAVLGAQPSAKPRAIVIGFIVFTALYVYAIGTAFELAENYRYRWLVEPLFTVLATVAITQLLQAVRERLTRRRAESAAA